MEDNCGHLPARTLQTENGTQTLVPAAESGFIAAYLSESVGARTMRNNSGVRETISTTIAVSGLAFVLAQDS